MGLKNPVKTVSYKLFEEIALENACFCPASDVADPVAACRLQRAGSAPCSVVGNYSATARHQRKGNEVAIYALGLVDTGYRFGGKNPEAGLDCSGMVSFIYDRAAGLRVKGSAADIARNGRPIEADSLRPGDLVFFNTRNRSFSHVGIYLGDARFIHAPSSNGKVRIDRLSDRYYAQRFEAARTFFD
jgi:cell wall-associated NlpC family hydrolase